MGGVMSSQKGAVMSMIPTGSTFGSTITRMVFLTRPLVLFPSKASTSMRYSPGCL